MENFTFITDDDFRKSLESDYNEMRKCLELGVWKAVHVLAGSIVESILIDYIIYAELETRDNALKLDFGRALTFCKDKNIITSKVAELSSVVKSYRNLIHPGRIQRLNEKIDEDSAHIAYALTNMVLKEVEEHKRRTYGYTAQQIVRKIELDSSAIAILHHLLKQTKNNEIERLLLNSLPEQYEYSELSTDTSIPLHAQSAYIECFKMAFVQATTETKRRVLENFAKHFRESSEETIELRVLPFLRIHQLEYTDTENANLIKQHLLKILEQTRSFKNNSRAVEIVINALDGIGKILTATDTSNFTNSILNLSTGFTKSKAWERLTLELDEMLPENREIANSIIKTHPKNNSGGYLTKDSDNDENIPF